MQVLGDIHGVYRSDRDLVLVSPIATNLAVTKSVLSKESRDFGVPFHDSRRCRDVIFCLVLSPWICNWGHCMELGFGIDGKVFDMT